MKKALISIILALALVVAACGDDDEGAGTGQESDSETALAASTEDPIVIGAAIARTGFVSFYDLAVADAMEIAVDDINAAGGLLGRQLKLVYADNQSNLDQIVPAALDVIGQGADVVITSSDYDFGGPAARAANEAGLLALGAAGSPLYGRTGIGPLTFSTLAPTPTEAAAMAHFTWDRGWRRPYLLRDESVEYSKSLCDYFEQSWAQLGGEAPAGVDSFLNSDANISSQVTRLEQADADAVVLCSFPPGGATAIRQIRAAGIDLPIVSTAGFDGLFWVEAVPDATGIFNTTLGSLFGDDPDDEVNELVEKYRERYDRDPPQSYVVVGYSMIQTLARAIEMADSIDGAALAQALESFENEKFLAGPTSYTADCHMPRNRPVRILEWNAGTPRYAETVTPTAIAEAPC